MTSIIIGILLPLAGTMLGSSFVFFMRKEIPDRLKKTLLGFASGVMVYVVVEELIPETAQGRHTNLSTLCFALGFVLMMVLDVLLG